MKSIKIIIFILLITALLIGCSKINTEIEEEFPDFPVPDVKEIEMWTSWLSLDRETADELIEAFVADNPEFTLTIVLDNGSDGNKLAASITSGTAPDLIDNSGVKGLYYIRG